MTETEVLFTRLFKCDRAALYLDKERRLTGEQSHIIVDTLKRRIAGEPFEYILGDCEFMGLQFRVDRRALIPRPETEILVETALRIAGSMRQRSRLTLLDAGTGSGNIAVALARSLPSAALIACDISQAALALARANAESNGCSGRIRFVRCDMLAGFGLVDNACDMVVSNPPYIVSGEIDGLQPEVRREPRAALDGGNDGLLFYRKIAGQAQRLLRPGGALIVEIGAGQCADVKRIFEGQGGFSVRDIVKDYNGIERVIVAQPLSIHG
jgi:release factor glutamine methyltransferase